MALPNPQDLIIINRGVRAGDGLRDHPQDLSLTLSAPSQQEKIDTSVSPINQCQTEHANQLVIYDAIHKLKNESDNYHIGGTYSGSEPELWFYFTTSYCHGNNYLLNLFVRLRKPGNFCIQVSDSNQLIAKHNREEDLPNLLLPNTMTAGITLRSTKPNQTYFIKTYCFNKEIREFNIASILVIPVKIVVDPKYVLNESIVNSMKLQHDLSGLLTKQEKTDFILESSTRKQFPTHKIILAAHSPVLRNMIKNSNLTSLFIDISDNDLELLLEFIYTGTIVNVMKQDCLKLLEIADKFQLKPLFLLTQYTIGDQITVSNAVEIAVIAKKYNLTELQNKVFEFIIKNPEVMKTAAWTNLKDVELTKYLFQYMHSMRN